MREFTIRGGSVINGLGIPRYRADLYIENGVIAAIDRELPPKGPEIDATGQIVAPGLIDIHSHLDAEALWALPPPVSRAGVATAIVGNCGYSLGPWAQAVHAQMLDHLCAREGWDREELAAALPRPFSTFSAALAAVDACEWPLNLKSFIGYDALLAWAREDISACEPPNNDQLATMSRALSDSLDQNALGLSISLRTASLSRLSALRSLLHLTRPPSNTLLQVALPESSAHEGLRDHLEDALIKLCAQFEMTVSWTVFAKQSDEGYHLRRLERLHNRPNADASVAVQVMPISPGPLTVLSSRRELRLLLSQEPAELDRYRFVSPVRLRGVPLATMATHGQIDQSGIGMADTDPVIVQRVQGNPSWQTIRDLLESPDCVIGGSDSGAMPKTVQNAGMFPTLLSREARKALNLSLEDAVFRMTSQLVERFGLEGCGRLIRGHAADILIFDPDKIAAGSLVPRYYDGQLQSYDQETLGITAVIKGGNVTFSSSQVPKSGE